MIELTVRMLRGGANALEARGAQLRFRDAPVEVDAAYEFVRDFRYGTVHPAPWQVREEILGLLGRLQARPPRRVVELGTALGGTLFLLTRVATPDATLVSVDMAAGAFGGGYPRVQAPLLRSFARGQQKIELVRGDSHSDTIVKRVKDAAGGMLDFLFIDADHTYEGVRTDYELYSPLVRDGGLIAFHDIVDGAPEDVGGVPDFWRELKARFPDSTDEIVHNWGQGGYGIGVLHRST